MGILDKVAARTESIVSSAEASGGDDGGGDASIGEELVSEVQGGASDGELPDPGALEAGAAPSVPDENTQRRSILEEKLAAAREQRQAARIRREQADREARGAQQARVRAEREAVALREEREKLNRTLREGSFKEGLQALGRDPRKTFEEMQREAVEAGTPEGQIRRLQETIDEKIATLDERLKRLDDAHERMTQSEVHARFQTDFQRNVVQPGYEILREAYDDHEILGFADALRKDPQRMVDMARNYGVRLTNPQRGFFMREILEVLKAVQVDYDGRRNARRERIRGPKPAPKVNGTTGTKAPAGTIDNELASARVSNGSAKLSRSDRIEAEISRLEGR